MLLSLGAVLTYLEDQEVFSLDEYAQCLQALLILRRGHDLATHTVLSTRTNNTRRRMKNLQYSL
jgi:hypothetical protein